MKRSNRFGVGASVLIVVAGAAGLGGWAIAQQPEPAGAKAEAGEHAIKLSEAPDAVRAALVKITPADKVTEVTRESHKGVTVYEIEYAAEGGECSVVFSAAGEVMELEKEIKEAALPAAALAALRKAYPDAKFGEITLVQEFSYEVEFKVDGKTHEVELNAAGQIDDDDDEDGEDDDD